MNTNIALTLPDPYPDPPLDDLDGILPKVELIEDDGEPLESDWHRRAMNLLIDSMEHHFRDRQDYYTGGNMFIYFSEEQARNRDFRGPDFFFVWKTARQPQRRYWVVWQEGGRTPNVVVELTSPTTRRADHGVKKDIYEQVLRVPDYFCFDPNGNQLEGWRLYGREYATLTPSEKGWLWSEELQLWIGAWQGKVSDFEGVYPRFYDAAGNLVLTDREAARALAEREHALRLSAEAELALLRKRLASLENGQPRGE